MFLMALWMASAQAKCHGILAGPECCTPQELDGDVLQKEFQDFILQENMMRFGKVVGDGSHHFESSLNPVLCEKDCHAIHSMKELRETAVALHPQGEASEHEKIKRYAEVCAAKNGRLVQIDVKLQFAGDCNMDHRGAFCSPFSCAVVYEKWVSSAKYFIQNFPHCSSFALQPCVWQNAAKLSRMVSLMELPQLFETIEITDENNMSVEVQNLLEAVQDVKENNLIPWQFLRPFADNNADRFGQKQPLKIPKDQLNEKLLTTFLDVSAGPGRAFIADAEASICHSSGWMASSAAMELTGCSCRARPTPCFRPLGGHRDAHGDQRRLRRAVVTAFDLQIPLEKPYRTWGLHDAPLDFLHNFDLTHTSGDPVERVLLLPPESLALYPLSWRTRQRLRRYKVRLIEVPWIEPPGISPTVAQRNLENHFGNREYIRLHAMNLDYDVVVYLDTDMRIVGDLNPIFQHGQDLFLTTGSMVAPMDGGFFAVKPSGALFRAMLDVLRTVHYDRETGWNRMGHGHSLALGTAEGNYPAGPQGFLYHFFYMADPAVDLALRKNGILQRPKSAQVDACHWNYNSFHGNFKWRYLDEYSYFAAMPPEWRSQVEAFHGRIPWTFPCDFTMTKPVLVHHLDEAIENHLLYLQAKHPNRTTVLVRRT